MTEPLDLEPIKARLAYLPEIGTHVDRAMIGLLLAEVERLRAFIQGCRSNDCDRWLYPDGQV